MARALLGTPASVQRPYTTAIPDDSSVSPDTLLSLLFPGLPTSFVYSRRFQHRVLTRSLSLGRLQPYTYFIPQRIPSQQHPPLLSLPHSCRILHPEESKLLLLRRGYLLVSRTSPANVRTSTCDIIMSSEKAVNPKEKLEGMYQGRV